MDAPTTPETREPSAPPLPVWAMVDPESRDTAPRNPPIRNSKRGVLMGRKVGPRRIVPGVMDMGAGL